VPASWGNAQIHLVNMKGWRKVRGYNISVTIHRTNNFNGASAKALIRPSCGPVAANTILKTDLRHPMIKQFPSPPSMIIIIGIIFVI